jgi:putative glutamine amidotransferase
VKLVAVTQRVDLVVDYQERRDALDQRWCRFLSTCGLIPLVIPNHSESAAKLLASVSVHGVLLTGGGDLAEYGGVSPERDCVEKQLMDFAIQKNVPLLGVCRGMQFIQSFFGIKLEKVSGHVTRQQEIVMNGRREVVNSYHCWGSRQSVDEIEVWARSSDDVVKAIRHIELPIQGIMWHPERIEPFSSRDQEIFCEHFHKFGS